MLAPPGSHLYKLHLSPNPWSVGRNFASPLQTPPLALFHNINYVALQKENKSDTQQNGSAGSHSHWGSGGWKYVKFAVLKLKIRNSKPWTAHAPPSIIIITLSRYNLSTDWHLFLKISPPLLLTYAPPVPNLPSLTWWKKPKNFI